MKTIIVGSGIIGVSIVYHLVVRGAEVAVVIGDDRSGISTRASFVWINAALSIPRFFF
jgi:glycine/D-amino acid oxidase-like deaminating enzyme